MKRELLIFSIFTGLLVMNSNLYGQESTSEEKKEIFLAFDKAIGSINTAIYQGVEYIEKHRMVNEKHKFFASGEFVAGKLQYDGQPFFEIPLKYNIFEDLLIISPSDKKGQGGFRLFENKLQGFELNGHNFVNIFSPSAAVKGIHEVLFENNRLQLLKKHRVKEKMIRKNSFVHFEFNAQKARYFFLYEGEYREMSRRNLLEAFPEQRSIIDEKFRLFRKQSGDRKDQSAVVLFKALTQNNN